MKVTTRWLTRYSRTALTFPSSVQEILHLYASLEAAHLVRVSKKIKVDSSPKLQHSATWVPPSPFGSEGFRVKRRKASCVRTLSTQELQEGSITLVSEASLLMILGELETALGIVA
jgi:hypothetical protein